MSSVYTWDEIKFKYPKFSLTVEKYLNVIGAERIGGEMTFEFPVEFINVFESIEYAGSPILSSNYFSTFINIFISYLSDYRAERENLTPDESILVMLDLHHRLKSKHKGLIEKISNEVYVVLR